MTSNISPEESVLLTKMLVSHAYRERLGAQRFISIVDCVDTPREEVSHLCHAIGEEYEHYRGCIDVGSDLGIPLVSSVDGRMMHGVDGIPPFESWLDFCLAHAFNDKAGEFVLEGIVGSRIEPYAKLARRILEDEKGHGEKGRELLVRNYSEYDEDFRQDRLRVHLDAAVMCLGRPGTNNDRRAVELGLKTKHSEQLIREFCAYADNVLREIGEGELTPLEKDYLGDKTK